LEKIPMPGPDDVTLAKAFLMHKMYWYGYLSGRHTSVDNLKKGCPLLTRPHIPDAIKELIRDGLLRRKPTSYGEQVCAVANTKGYGYANIYEREAKLPELEYGKPSGSVPKVIPLTPEELRALGRVHKKEPMRH
jgi:hypothetical protein